MPCHAPAGVVVFGGKDARWGEHMGMVCVVVSACVWLRLGVVAPCTLVDQARGSEEWSSLSLPIARDQRACHETTTTSYRPACSIWSAHPHPPITSSHAQFT